MSWLLAHNMIYKYDLSYYPFQTNYCTRIINGQFCGYDHKTNNHKNGKYYYNSYQTKECKIAFMERETMNNTIYTDPNYVTEIKYIKYIKEYNIFNKFMKVLYFRNTTQNIQQNRLTKKNRKERPESSYTTHQLYKKIIPQYLYKNIAEIVLLYYSGRCIMKKGYKGTCLYINCHYDYN
jgi:hypothetical protein